MLVTKITVAANVGYSNVSYKQFSNRQLYTDVGNKAFFGGKKTWTEVPSFLSFHMIPKVKNYPFRKIAYTILFLLFTTNQGSFISVRNAECPLPSTLSRFTRNERLFLGVL